MCEVEIVHTCVYVCVRTSTIMYVHACTCECVRLCTLTCMCVGGGKWGGEGVKGRESFILEVTCIFKRMFGHARSVICTYVPTDKCCRVQYSTVEYREAKQH